MVALEEAATLSGSGYGWGIKTNDERWYKMVHRLCVLASTTMTTTTATTDMTTDMTTDIRTGMQTDMTKTTTTGKLLT